MSERRDLIFNPLRWILGAEDYHRFGLWLARTFPWLERFVAWLNKKLERAGE